jgi:hypothetical protein
MLFSETPKEQEVQMLKVAHPWIKHKNLVENGVVFSFNSDGVATVKDLVGAREAIQILLNKQRGFFIPDAPVVSQPEPSQVVVAEPAAVIEQPKEVVVEQPEVLAIDPLPVSSPVVEEEVGEALAEQLQPSSKLDAHSLKHKHPMHKKTFKGKGD